jgi:hypothetical protein
VTQATTLIDEAEAAGLARRVVGDPESELLASATAPIPHVGIIDTTGGLHRVTGICFDLAEEVRP